MMLSVMETSNMQNPTKKHRTWTETRVHADDIISICINFYEILMHVSNTPNILMVVGVLLLLLLSFSFFFFGGGCAPPTVPPHEHHELLYNNYARAIGVKCPPHALEIVETHIFGRD